MALRRIRQGREGIWKYADVLLNNPEACLAGLPGSRHWGWGQWVWKWRRFLTVGRGSSLSSQTKRSPECCRFESTTTPEHQSHELGTLLIHFLIYFPGITIKNQTNKQTNRAARARFSLISQYIYNFQCPACSPLKIFFITTALS